VAKLNRSSNYSASARVEAQPRAAREFFRPRALTLSSPDRYTRRMAQTFFIFDFGTDEEAAQKARHRIEGWKQAFKLDRKMLVRFEREDSQPADAEKSAAKPHTKTKKHAEAGKSAGAGEAARVLLLVRLDFSDHEKLSHQRWLDRIPTEEIFAPSKSEVVAHGDKSFEATAARFEALEAQPGPPRAR
jgi:hypothetical protein